MSFCRVSGSSASNSAFGIGGLIVNAGERIFACAAPHRAMARVEQADDAGFIKRRDQIIGQQLNSRSAAAPTLKNAQRVGQGFAVKLIEHWLSPDRGLASQPHQEFASGFWPAFKTKPFSNANCLERITFLAFGDDRKAAVMRKGHKPAVMTLARLRLHP